MTLLKAQFLVERDYIRWEGKKIVARFNSQLFTVPVTKVYGIWRILNTTNEPDIFILQFRNSNKIMYYFSNN